MKEEEMLPDIPNIIFALEAILQDFYETEDMSKINKRQLGLNQQYFCEALIELARFVVSKAYRLDILDRLMARENTEKVDPTKEKIVDNDTNEILDKTMYL